MWGHREPWVAHLNELRQRHLQQEEKKHFEVSDGAGFHIRYW
jgi:hypothetical protein